MMNRAYYVMPAGLCVAMFFSRGVSGQHVQQTRHAMNSALQIEGTEMAAWRDLIDAAPDSFKVANGLGYCDVGGGLAINFQKEPIPLFNRVIGLGLTEPLTKDLIDKVKGFYTHHEKYLVHYSYPMQPVHADVLLKNSGLSAAGSWERIVRNDMPLNVLMPADDSIEVRRVDESLKEAWVEFLLNTYGFHFYEWPRAFALRKGWRHYVALRHHKIIACRSFFMTKEKTVFSGVDAPVPGVMTPDCVPDFAIWRKAIQDALEEGAILFVADIELADKEKNPAAYEGFTRLGFQIPYTRYHYRLSK